eukprot:1355172-Amorphochlora_amoeboformis.AAC.1
MNFFLNGDRSSLHSRSLSSPATAPPESKAARSSMARPSASDFAAHNTAPSVPSAVGPTVPYRSSKSQVESSLDDGMESGAHGHGGRKMQTVSRPNT